MQQRRDHRRVRDTVLSGLLSLGILIAFWTNAFAQAAEKAKPVDLATVITQLAKNNLPAVVYIEVTESKEVPNPFLPFESNPFFRQFFDIPKMPKKFKQELQGLGSGVIMDSEGHILTNYHVAGGATKIQVTLDDKNEYPATLVGGDPKTDLAVIKISPKGHLPHVTFGDSDNVEVGEWVVAIGAPRALEKSVTQGIISAKHRRGITDPSGYQDFLQTDAAINPGNSGGPLLNLRGEVIGINAAIITESGGFEGIGFTIPSNMAVYVAKALITHGKVERGWLGMTVQDVTPDFGRSHYLGITKGAYVTEVVNAGPADKAGIRRGDVVVAYRDKEIPDSGTLRDEVATTSIGEEVKVTIWRAGKKRDYTVKIGSLDAGTKLMAEDLKERLGAEVRPTNTLEAHKYDLKAHEGVTITSLEPDGPLQKGGFEVGDIILAINDAPVEGMESFVSIVSSLKPKEKVTLLVLDHRSGKTATIQVVTGVDHHFKLALEHFINKDAKGAASEIRKGAAVLKREGEWATGKGKELLTVSVRELEKLAEGVEKGLVTSAKELEKAFDRAYEALSSSKKQ
jgi:serine protease Do